MSAMSRGTARIGVLVPFTNNNLEADMALLRPNGISLHFARLRGNPDIFIRGHSRGQQVAQ